MNVLMTLVAVFAMGIAANAQQAIGVRLGNSWGLGGELSYQKDLGSNRLELDLGVSAGAGEYSSELHLNLTGIYQWTGTITGNFGWYAGVGGMLGLHTWDNPAGSNSSFWLGVAGQAGVEYNFQAVPIQISLDWRPVLSILNDDGVGIGFHPAGVALGVRYRF